MNGAQTLQIVKRTMQRYGQELTVTRPSDSTTRSVRFLPQPQKASADTYLTEGVANVSEANLHDFVCASDSDVKEGDFISYDDAEWRVANTNKNPMAGTAPVLHCFAVRQRQA